MLKELKEDFKQAYKFGLPFIGFGVFIGVLGEIYWEPLILAGIASIFVGCIIPMGTLLDPRISSSTPNHALLISKRANGWGF